MPFTDMSYLELWQPLCLAEQEYLCNFGRRHHEEQLCEIILNLDLWFRRKCRLFLSRDLKALCSVEKNHLCNFGRRHHEEQFCEINISYHLELSSLLFSRVEPFVQFW